MSAHDGARGSGWGLCRSFTRMLSKDLQARFTMPHDAAVPAHHSLGALARAAAFAAERHQGQRRKDAAGSPYISHPLAVVDVLVVEAGVTDIRVLCAALLHDVIEDTPTSLDELEAHFGAEIALVVMEVSDDKNLSTARRKQLQIEYAPRLSTPARLVKLADKICNLRDILHAPPIGWSTARRREYFEWAGQVIDGLRGTHAVLEAIFDAVHARQVELDERA